jgi:O-antigen/teichoic acid export membrane protein
MSKSIAGQLAVNVLAQGIARVLSIFANLVLVLVVARQMGAHFFGEFSYVLAFVTIGVALADMGTTAVLARVLSLHTGAERARQLGNFMLMRGALLLVVMLIGAAAAILRPNGVQAALLIATAGLPVLASRFFEPVYQVYERPWLSLWSNAVFGVAQLALAGVVLLQPDISVAALTAGFVLSNLVYAAVALLLMLRLVKPDLRPDAGVLRSLLAVAAPLGVSALFTSVISRADVLMLEHFLGPVAVGQYSAAYRVLDVAIFAAITVVTPLIPILTVEIARDRAASIELCKVIVQAALVCALPVAVVAPHAAEPVIALLLGSEYLPAVAPLLILVWNFVLIVVTLIGSSVNLAIGEVAHGYWNTALAALVNIALNLWLIPRYGTSGAALAAVCGQLSMMAVSQYYVFTRFGNLYPLRPMASIAAASLALALALFVAVPVIGWLPAVALAVLAYGALVVRLELLPVTGLRALLEARRLRRQAAST